MKYNELLEKARNLSAEQLRADLESLSCDPRFAAVVALAHRDRELFVNAGSKQELADVPGKLAHAQGSVHACNLLLAQLAQVIEPRAATGGMSPP